MLHFKFSVKSFCLSIHMYIRLFLFLDLLNGGPVKISTHSWEKVFSLRMKVNKPIDNYIGLFFQYNARFKYMKRYLYKKNCIKKEHVNLLLKFNWLVVKTGNRLDISQVDTFHNKVIIICHNMGSGQFFTMKLFEIV